MISVAEISKRLADRALDVCLKLIPGGKEVGGDYVCGSVTGGEGQSLKVHLSGQHAGHWRDWANQDDHGDLLDLWAASMGIQMADAINQAKDYLGIREAELAAKKTYTKAPEKDHAPPAEGGRSMLWLTKKRKLAPETIAAFKVSTQKEPQAIVFPCYNPAGELINRSYRTLPKDGEKKNVWQDKGCAPCLFGWHALPKSAYQERTVLLSEGQCLTGETEILTPQGWVRLDAWNGEMVAQWESGMSEFVNPMAYIKKEYSGEMYQFTSKSCSVDLRVTPDHKILYNPVITPRDHVCTAEEAPKTVAFYRSANLSCPGIDYRDEEIRLYAAIQADAHLENEFCKSSSDGWKMEFSKTRKIERLRALLSACSIDYKEYKSKHGTTFRFRADRGRYSKIFSVDLYRMSLHQRTVFADEVSFWDSYIDKTGRVTYTTRIKENADLVQWSVSMSGGYAKISYRDRGGNRSRQYMVMWINDRVRGNNKLTSRSIGKQKFTHSGFVYCVQVPSGFILTRLNGSICVTGNCDAMTWHQWGIPALSIPNGSGQAWIEYEWENLAIFDTIYIAFDNDAAGRENANKAIKRLGSHRCLLVEFPHKDANEALQAGVGYLEARQWVSDAKPIKMSKLVTANDLKERLISEIRVKPKAFTIRAFDKKWPHYGLYFRPGEVTLWTGAYGNGKSTFLNYMIVTLLAQHSHVFIASMEIKPEKTIQRIAQMTLAESKVDPVVAAKPESYESWLTNFGDLISLSDIVGHIEQDQLFEMMEYAFSRYGAEHCIIDSLMRIAGLEEDYPAQAKFINRLQEFAKRTGVHVHMVTHPRKLEKGGRPDGTDIKGSSAIPNNADSIVSVVRNYEKIKLAKERELTYDEEEEMHDTEIIVDKQRENGWIGCFYLKFNKQSLTFTPMPDGYSPSKPAKKAPSNSWSKKPGW